MIPRFSLISLLLAAPFAHGAAGMFDQFLFTTTNNGALAFYDIGAVTTNPDFQGNSLGIINSTDTFEIGGQQKTFKNNSSDITASSLRYRVWQTSTGPAGSFTTVNMPFQTNIGGGGDQQWGGNVSGSNTSLVKSSNIVSGLSNGSYTLEVFSQISTNGVNAAATEFNNNAGNNYRATFNVVPEPSAALIGALGSLLLLRRRK